MELLLKTSSLANELRQIYHGIVGGSSVCFSINSSPVFISVKLWPSHEYPQKRVLRPYHTMLPIGSNEIIVNLLSAIDPSVGGNASNVHPKLMALLACSSPMTSFDEISIEMEEPTEAVSPIESSHFLSLVYFAICLHPCVDFISWARH